MRFALVSVCLTTIVAIPLEATCPHIIDPSGTRFVIEQGGAKNGIFAMVYTDLGLIGMFQQEGTGYVLRTEPGQPVISIQMGSNSARIFDCESNPLGHIDLSGEPVFYPFSPPAFSPSQYTLYQASGPMIGSVAAQEITPWALVMRAPDGSQMATLTLATDRPMAWLSIQGSHNAVSILALAALNRVLSPLVEPTSPSNYVDPTPIVGSIGIVATVVASSVLGCVFRNKIKNGVTMCKTRCGNLFS